MFRSTTLLTTIFTQLQFSAEETHQIIHRDMPYALFIRILHKIQHHQLVLQDTRFFGLITQTLDKNYITEYVNQFLFDAYPEFYATLAFNRLNSHDEFEEVSGYFHFGNLLDFFDGNVDTVLSIWQQRLEKHAYTYVNEIPNHYRPAVLQTMLALLAKQTTFDDQIDMLYYIYDHFDKSEVLQVWPSYHAEGHTLFSPALIAEMLPIESISSSHPLWNCVPHDRFFDIRVMMDTVPVNQTPLIYERMNDSFFDGLTDYPEAIVHYLEWLSAHPGPLEEEVVALIEDVPLEDMEEMEPSIAQRFQTLQRRYAHA